MNHNHIIQCKRVILHNKKSSKFVKLTLADRLYLIMISKKLKKERVIDCLTFEEFTLICKQHKKMANLRVESKHSTSFIDILQFNTHTLHDVLYKIINEIELYNEEDKYNNIEDVIYLLRVNPVILFNTFNEICDSLKVKVSIE